MSREAVFRALEQKHGLAITRLTAPQLAMAV
jgi:hypothetical protein